MSKLVDVILKRLVEISNTTTGIFDINEVGDAFKHVTNSDESVVCEFLNEYERIINELTIREKTGTDGILSVKADFIEKLKRIDPSLSTNISVGDELIRQNDVRDTDGVKIKISPTSLSITDSVSDTMWVSPKLPNVAFYIPYLTQVNSLLKRTKSSAGSDGKVKLKSTDTEILHECFFVVALAQCIDSDGQSVAIRNSKNLSEVIHSVNNTNIKINDKEKIQLAFESIISDILDEPVLDRLYDACDCALAVYDKLVKKYETKDFSYVMRVFSLNSGKKSLTDAMVTARGETTHISLKYKTGQLNNLNVNTVLNTLFGIDVKSNQSFFENLYKFEPTKIDELLRFFINGINTYLPPKDQKHRIDGSTITYPEFTKLKNSYYPLAYFTLLTELSKDDEKILKFINDYKTLKSVNLASTINRYIENKKTRSVDLLSFLTYTLRCQNDSRYMYVSSGGKVIYDVPSKSDLLSRRIEIKSKFKENRSDYTSDISVFIDEKLVFEFEIIFRWTKSQWNGDLSQVGKNLKVYEFDWN